MDIADTVKFHNVCTMLEKLKSAPTEAAKGKYLRRYYESFLKHREQFRHRNDMTGDEETGSSSFYCVLRCLLPNADRARNPYGLQITTLGKVYIKVLQLSADCRDANRLCARSYSGIRGDYADVVCAVLQPRGRTENSSLSMKQVHAMLDAIAAGDQKCTEMILTRLWETASVDEQKWFIRLLLKSMHLRLRDESVFAVLHPQAKEVFRRCSCLARLCCMLANNVLPAAATSESHPKIEGYAGGRHDDAVEPFQHVRPMLCEIFPGNIETLMSADVLYLEMKMDGERFQLHYHDGNFKYLSRNGVDYTFAFGAAYDKGGSLTPRLVNLLPTSMQSIILDGEMMVWDTRTLRYVVKGENTDVKHLNANGPWQPCFVVYDLLYLNGRCLLDLPYIQRSHKLRDVVKEQPGILVTMKPRKIRTKEEFRNLYQDALNANEEGVVLKKQNAAYKAGVRNGGGWYKVKADYIRGLTTEFDLLVMGGFYNRTRTYVESFLVGVLKCNGNGDGDGDSINNCHIYSVGKVANVIRQRNVLNESLKDYWLAIDSDPPPLWYHYANTAEGRPDIWIQPRHSQCLQIKATDLAPSSAFVLSKALHFGRIQAWRKDKMWNECMTIGEYMALCEKSKGGVLKITKRELRLDDFTGEHRPAKMTPAQIRKMGALAYECKVNCAEIVKTSDILQKFTFCVLSTKLNSGHTVADLKRLIVSNGGEIVENPLYDDPYCICVSGDMTFRVENLCRARQCNIVTMAWLLATCTQQRIRLRPTDMICMTETLQSQFREQYDEFGDSYTQPVEPDELAAILDEMGNHPKIRTFRLSTEELFNIEAELYGNRSPNYFRKDCAYFYGEAEPDVTLSKLLFQWRGGRLGEGDTKSIPLIFVNMKTFEANIFRSWRDKSSSSFADDVKIVNLDWILHCEDYKCRHSMDEFIWRETSDS